MSPSKVVLLSVGLSVVASVVTTYALAPARERAGYAPRSSVDVPEATPDAEGALPAPRGTEGIAELREAVRRLEAKVEAPPARHAEDALAVLLGIKQGERQLAIEESLKELTALGNDVVPQIVALLKSGEDQDYGGGFSFGGNKMRGYPRLRTVLIDVLRQIGTPEAQRGLLEGLRGTDDPLDYRDVLLLYGSTNDEIMVKGIAAMMPDILRAARSAGDEGTFLLDSTTSWILRHEMKETTAALEEIARDNLAASRPDRGAFPALVAFSPERAFALVREQYANQGETVIRTASPGLRAARADVPLAQVARFSELILSLELTEVTRGMFYMSLPDRLCSSIESADARKADGRVLLEFYRKRLAVETSEMSTRTISRHIAKLEQALEQ